MGIKRIFKVAALFAATLLIGTVAAACSGSSDTASTSDPAGLVPQRANLVGSIDIDELLKALDLDYEQINQLFSSQLTSSDLLGETEGLEELLDLDSSKIGDLFVDVRRAGIFAETDVTGNADYFGVTLIGDFAESEMIAELETIAGIVLDKEAYKGSNVYSSKEDGEVFSASVLDSNTFVFGSDEAIKDVIDIWVSDADGASGSLISTFNDTKDGLFGVAAVIPDDAFDDQDLGSLPGLEGLPVPLDFITALEVLGVGGNLEGDDIEIKIALGFTSNEAAESLDELISSVLSLASVFAPDPETTNLLSGMDVDRDGSRITITFQVPKSALSDMFSDLTNVSSTTSLVGVLPVRPRPGWGHEVNLMPSADHVEEGQTVEYSTTPPTSGQHWPRWADCGWYPDGLPDETITHNLEHGNIVVSYNLANPAEVTELRNFLENLGQFDDWGVARSYDEIPEGHIVLAAWGLMATYDGVLTQDSPRDMEFFFQANAGLLGRERVPC